MPTARTSSARVPGRTSTEKATGTVISRTIISGSPVASSSSVTGTEPSTEFSIGTTAASASPERTASSATITVEHGSGSDSASPGQAAQRLLGEGAARAEVGDPPAGRTGGEGAAGGVVTGPG